MGAYNTTVYRQAKARFRGLPCIYCGQPSDTVEHIMPVSRGGSSYDPANLAPCCSHCNYSRGAKMKKGRRYLPPANRTYVNPALEA